MHYGVKGMKWGVHKQRPVSLNSRSISDEQRAQRRKTAKRAAIIGASVVAAGLAVYGAHKVSEVRKMNTAAVQEYLKRNTQNYTEDISRFRNGGSAENYKHYKITNNKLWGRL